MKRVVVTGIGIVSSLGNNCREVLASLQNLKPGISFDESYRAMGLRSHVAPASWQAAAAHHRLRKWKPPTCCARAASSASGLTP